MTDAIASLGAIDDRAIELDLAALELSALDHVGADLAPYLTLFDEIGAALAAEGGEAETGEVQAAALKAVLHGRFDFTGDRGAYDAVVNADMIRVIDRRRGLPVALSILYVAQARRRGWTADAMDLPGHVLVRLGPPAERVLLDPFNDGAFYPVEQLGPMIGRMVGSGQTPSTIAPMANRVVLMRLLMNQASRAEQDGDLERAITCFDRMVAIGPRYPHPRWERVRLQLRTGDHEAARRGLNDLHAMATDEEVRRRIAGAIEMVERRSEDKN